MIIKCENGHWYDANVNKSCPHCRRESEKLSIRLDDIEEDDKTISIAEVDLSLGEELGAIIGGTAGNMISDVADTVSMEDEDKTISFGFFGMMELQPVTGWLVCMSGSEKGKDYRLHTGKNFVGRSTTMDVVLIDDKTIARDKHCAIVYEPKENIFYVSNENGNLTYLNGERIDLPLKIQEGDQITIGETTLMFIPFCGEGRIWEREEKEP